MENWDVVEELAEQVAEALAAMRESIMRVVTDFAERWQACLWAMYTSAGKPCGDSQEGMRRWWDGLCAESRVIQAEAAAKEEREWRETLVELEKFVASQASGQGGA